MTFYTVEVSRVVRDVLACTIEVEADSLEAAQAEAMRQWQAGDIELHFEQCLDAEEPEAYARECKPCGGK